MRFEPHICGLAGEGWLCSACEVVRDEMEWVDEIEAQIDDTVPYYVPRLIAKIRTLHKLLGYRGNR